MGARWEAFKDLFSSHRRKTAHGYNEGGVSPEMTRIANQHAIQRELQGKSPFWKTGEEVATLPDYQRTEPEYRPLPPEQVTVTQGPEKNLFSTGNAFADDSPQPIKATKEQIREHDFNNREHDFNKMLDTAAGYEGFVDSVNYDTTGKGAKEGGGSIGYGTQITDPTVQKMMRSLGLEPEDYLSGEKKLSKADAKLLLVEGMNTAMEDARSFLPDFEEHPSAVREVLVDMSYNMGATTLGQFKNFKAALKDKDYKTAAKEMKNSNWFNQTGRRARDLHKQMLRV